jgi:hypothetical protein
MPLDDYPDDGQSFAFHESRFGPYISLAYRDVREFNHAMSSADAVRNSVWGSCEPTIATVRLRGIVTHVSGC